MRTLSLGLALSLLSAPAWAQCFDTAYGNPLGVAGQLFGDVVFPMQPIGFAFPLGATTYTDVHVCDKGYVFLSNAGVPAPGFADFSATPAELASGEPRVCALWSDIQVLSSNNGMVYLKSTPTACTITWINAQCYQQTSGLFDMQMVLEPSGIVRVLFGPGTTNNSTQPTWLVGIAGISPGNTTVPSPSDLSAGGSTPASVVYEEWNVANGFDLASNGLIYVPGSPGWAFSTVGAPVNCATATQFGDGCGDQSDSFFEAFSGPAFDLSGRTITMFRQAGGYLVLDSVPGTFVTPSGSATVVANGDDIEQTVTLASPMPVAGGTTSSLTICSNGRVSLGALGNGTSFFPDPQTFLDFAETTIAAAWHDYNPTITGSGAITFEQMGSTAYVTWNNVYSYGTTQPDTFQYQFDLASGNVTIVYGAFTLAGNDYLTGYSVGGPSTASSLDLSAVLGATLTVNDTASSGLVLTTNTSPAIGNAGFAFVIQNVPPLVPIGVLFFGDTAINPGLDLTFLGMPGCFAYTSGNLAAPSFAVTGGVGTVPLPIPNNPALIGLTLTSQALAFSTVTPAGLITSNGLTTTLGN